MTTTIKALNDILALIAMLTLMVVWATTQNIPDMIVLAFISLASRLAYYGIKE